MAASPGTDSTDLEQMRKDLYGEFEELLRGQGNLEAADRDSMLRHFRDALNDEAALSAPVDFARMQADVASTLGLMQQHGIIDGDDGQQMEQVFAKALRPLQDESLQRAVEFGRRVREDGQESAGEWLASEASARQAQSQLPQGMPAHVANALGGTGRGRR